MSKIEKSLFYLFIFCLPFQTRKILYQWGTGFNEWTSAYLYLTDILLILVFLFWFWRRRKERYLKDGLKISQCLKTAGFWLVVFVVIAFISLSRARNIELGFYTWLKLLELAALFFYSKNNIMCHSDPAAGGGRIPWDNSDDGILRDTSDFRPQDDDKISFRNLARVFVLSGFIQAIIAWGQFLKQGSLGLKWLAESPLSLDKIGVAKIVVDGVKMLRSYGSLPHPNLLAAFLFVSIFFLYFLWLSRERLFIGHLFFLSLFYILFFGLCLTFSRAVILTFLLASFLYFVFCLWQVVQTTDIGLFKRLILVFLIFILLTGFFAFIFRPETASRFNFSFKEEAVSLRIFYNETALTTISRQPWLGLGAGNFVREIQDELYLLSSWLHQPVHNIYLLIAAETGLLGLVAFLMFVFLSFLHFVSFPHKLVPAPIGERESSVAEVSQNYFIPRNLFILLFLSFLFIGLFDHFFLTLQQGQLLSWLILGLVSVNFELS